jgi:hypothetical protein
MHIYLEPKYSIRYYAQARGGREARSCLLKRGEDEDEENLKRGRLHFETRQLSEARKGWEGDQGGRDGRDTRDARTRPGQARLGWRASKGLASQSAK